MNTDNLTFVNFCTVTEEQLTAILQTEQRERDKAIRRAFKKVEEAEAEVTRLEAAVKDIEQQIADGSTDPKIYDKHATANKDLENAMSVWELATISKSNREPEYIKAMI